MAQRAAATDGDNLTPATVGSLLGARAGRHQFVPRASAQLVVWEDRKAWHPPLDGAPSKDDTLGSSDVFAYDVAAGTVRVVSDAPGDQTEPTVSGTLVAYVSDNAACPTCGKDIVAKDMANGATYVVAGGSADERGPSIWGRDVAWVEYGPAGRRLLLRNLDSFATVEVARQDDARLTMTPPVINADVIVWGEVEPRGKATLYAYLRLTGQRVAVGQATERGLAYAVSGTRVAWTSPAMVVSDVATGATSELWRGRSYSPSLDGDLVIWSTTLDGVTQSAVGARLSDGIVRRIAGGAGYRGVPRIEGGVLYWRDEDGSAARIRTGGSATGLFATAPLVAPVLAATPTPAPTWPALVPTAQALTVGARSVTARDVNQDPVSDELADGDELLRAAAVWPTSKGIHAATGAGWGDVTAWSTVPQKVDSLQSYYDANGPYFGSVVVLYSDMKSRAGLAAHMQWLQASGVRVVLRIDPTGQPLTSSGPADVVGRVNDAVVSWGGWLRYIQVDNEPNLEWPRGCTYASCDWQKRDGSTNHTEYTDMFDSRMYSQIQAFYVDVHDRIVDLRAANATYANIQFWTPPVADIFQNVTGGTGGTMYDYMGTMLYTYATAGGGLPGAGLTYHTYANPNYDSVVGRIVNNSYLNFPGWLQQAVDNPSGGGGRRTMITEFGWSPGQMEICSYAQSSIWVGAPDGQAVGAGSSCSANDGADHAFAADIAGFRAYELHNAEVLAVWLIGGNYPRSNGVYATQRLKWLVDYRAAG